MPVHVKHGSGSRPYKIVENSTGKVVGSSKTRKDAEISAWKRNKAYKKKKS